MLHLRCHLAVETLGCRRLAPEGSETTKRRIKASKAKYPKRKKKIIRECLRSTVELALMSQMGFLGNNDSQVGWWDRPEGWNGFAEPPLRSAE